MERYKGMFSGYGLLAKLFLLTGFPIFFGTLAVMISLFFVGGQVDSTGSLRIVQLFQSVGMFLLPALLLAFLFSSNPCSFLHIDKFPGWKLLLFVALYMICIIPGINLLADLNRQVVLPGFLSGVEVWMKKTEAEAAKLTEQLMAIRTTGDFLLNILIVAVVAAVGEELFFRGLLQSVLGQKMNVSSAIWLTAIVFSAIHLQFYGFLPRMLLGALFGFLLWRSGSIWLPVMAHFINNLMGVIFYSLKSVGYKLPDIDGVGTGSTWWLGVVSIVFGVAAGVFLTRACVARST